jgi:hypothetical protein
MRMTHSRVLMGQCDLRILPEKATGISDGVLHPGVGASSVKDKLQWFGAAMLATDASIATMAPNQAAPSDHS